LRVGQEHLAAWRVVSNISAGTRKHQTNE
jgi:hypothetical protein